jgi:hypothetical protein
MAKIELHPDFKEFLRFLNFHKAEFFPKANKRAHDRHKDLEDLEHLP